MISVLFCSFSLSSLMNCWFTKQKRKHEKNWRLYVAVSGICLLCFHRNYHTFFIAHTHRERKREPMENSVRGNQPLISAESNSNNNNKLEKFLVSITCNIWTTWHGPAQSRLLCALLLAFKHHRAWIMHAIWFFRFQAFWHLYLCKSNYLWLAYVTIVHVPLWRLFARLNRSEQIPTNWCNNRESFSLSSPLSFIRLPSPVQIRPQNV